MHSITGPADLKISPLRGRAMRQTRIPADRNRDGTTVVQINRKGVVGDCYIQDSS